MNLAIPDDAWTETPDGGRLVASVSINGLPCLAEAFPVDHSDDLDDDLALLHAASHADGPFQSLQIQGRRYVVAVLPHA